MSQAASQLSSISEPIARTQQSQQRGQRIDLPSRVELEREIVQEIAAHGVTWCFSHCATFRPDLYRKHRLQGIPLKRLRRLHDLYHVGDDD